MKCLRCGYCCLNYNKVIIDNPEKGLVKGNTILLDGTTRCKHLSGDAPGSYHCKIYNYPWFKDTPCGQFTQSKDTPKLLCRMGEFILNEEIERNSYSHKEIK